MSTVTRLRTYAPIIGGLGTVFVGTYAWNQYHRGNGFKTPGIGNIEKAYGAGGATHTHTPAFGGTKRGDEHDVDPKDGGASKTKFSVGAGMGDEQRPAQPTALGQNFNEMKYGNKDQK